MNNENPLKAAGEEVSNSCSTTNSLTVPHTPLHLYRVESHIRSGYEKEEFERYQSGNQKP